GGNKVCAAGTRCSPPGIVLGRVHIYGYGRSLRPPQGTRIAPRRRALFRQTLLAPEAGEAAEGGGTGTNRGELGDGVARSFVEAATDERDHGHGGCEKE